MTATAVGNGLPGAGLTDHQRERISDARPDDRAPEEAHNEPEVEVNKDVVVHSRLREVNVLPILATVQLTWMAALGYELLHHLR
jgi:hypothetical protein